MIVPHHRLYLGMMLKLLNSLNHMPMISPISQMNHSHKQHVSLALMAHVHETCDIESFPNAQGQPKWE